MFVEVLATQVLEISEKLKLTLCDATQNKSAVNASTDLCKIFKALFQQHLG